MNETQTRRLLRVGTPLSAQRLRKHLEAIEEPNATVRQLGHDLIVEAPDEQLPLSSNGSE